MKKFSILLSFIAVAVCASAQMAIPTLSSPSNGLTNATVRQTFSWSRIAAATGYIFQLDTSATFSSPMFYEATQTNTSSSSTAPSRYHNYLHYNTTYYWRVRAYNATDTSDWSAVRNFHTDYHPYLSSPNNDTSSTGNYYSRIHFQWQYFYGSTGYTLQVDTTPAFSSPLLRTETVASTLSNTDNLSKYVYGLRFGTMYYWRVQAYHQEDTSDWSAVRQFHTQSRVTLYSPSNGLTNATVRQNLQWNNAVGCTSYQLQVDSSDSFTSPHLKTFTVTNTQSNTDSYLSQYVSYLLYGTHYYWRVRAINASDTSDWSNVWQFITDDKVYLSSPSNDTIYYIATRQNFQWNYFYGSTGYILQVDTTPSFSSPLLVTENVTCSLSNTDNLSKYVNNMHFGTRYYWRVRAYHTQDTSGWSFVRQFRTTAHTSLYYPDHDTVASSRYYTRINSFQWYNSRGCTAYHLQIDTTPEFSSPLLRVVTTTSTVSNTDTYISQTVNDLHFNKHYYWRVRAINANDTSNWSPVRQFYTTARTSLYHPDHDTIASSRYYTRIQFEWYNSRGCTAYHLQVDTTPNFFSPLLLTTTTTTTVTNTDTYIYQYLNYLHYNTHYYWRVRAVNSSDTSNWSLVRQFTTSRRPSLNSPTDGSTGQSINSLNLYCNNHKGSTSYVIQLDTTPLFNSPLRRVKTLTTTVSNTNTTVSGQESNLRYGTTYYWRAKAYHQDDSSEWSLTWKFTTQYNVTTGPTLSSPANDSVGVAHNAAILSWQSLSGMTGYRYWVSTNSSFSDTVTRGETTLTFTMLNNLYPSTTYYWKVQGTNTAGNTSWSSTWHFTTADVFLAAPQLVSPTNRSDVQQSSVQLSWGSVFGALTYQVQFSLDSLFQTAVSSYTTADTHYSISGLPRNMNYYWRVRSANGNTTSDWSNVWAFHTTACTATSATIDTAICEECSYDFFGTTLSTSGTYTHTLSNTQGCDSVVTLHLIVYHTVHDTTYITLYDTTLVHDTTIVHDTTVVHHYVHDTTFVPVHDTTYINNYIHDTTVVTIHDTTIVNHYIHDTTLVTIHDTTVITLHDTTVITVHDTIFNSQLSTFNLVVSSVQQIGIAVGSGRFADSTLVEIAAIPVCGNHFVQWSDGNTENPRHVLVTEDITLTATFDVDAVGITNVESPSATITVEGGILTVQGAAGKRVRIFDEVGRLLATQDNLPETHSFRLPAAGVYLIQIGTGAAQRVVVR